MSGEGAHIGLREGTRAALVLRHRNIKPTVTAFRHEVRRLRVLEGEISPETMVNLAGAAFILVTSRAEVRRLIRSGELPGELVPRPGDPERFSWAIPHVDVVEIGRRWVDRDDAKAVIL